MSSNIELKNSIYAHIKNLENHPDRIKNLKQADRRALYRLFSDSLNNSELVSLNKRLSELDQENPQLLRTTNIFKKIGRGWNNYKNDRIKSDDLIAFLKSRSIHFKENSKNKSSESEKHESEKKPISAEAPRKEKKSSKKPKQPSEKPSDLVEKAKSEERPDKVAKPVVVQTVRIEFDPVKFKVQALELMSGKNLSLPTIDPSKIELEEKHVKILERGTLKALREGRDQGLVEIIRLQGRWGVFSFTDIKDVVFKFFFHDIGWNMDYTLEPHMGEFKLDKGQAIPGWVDRVGCHIVSSEKGQEIAKKYDLYCLHIAQAALLPVKDTGSMIVEERFESPWYTWQQQEKIYQFIQSDPELSEYAVEVFKQLILFTVISGFGNTKYDKIQIMPNGKIALHDLNIASGYYRGRNEPKIFSGTYGLYDSACYEEKGIFDHILPHFRAELKIYALEVTKQHCPDQYERLVQKLKAF